MVGTEDKKGKPVPCPLWLPTAWSPRELTGANAVTQAGHSPGTEVHQHLLKASRSRGLGSAHCCGVQRYDHSLARETCSPGACRRQNMTAGRVSSEEACSTRGKQGWRNCTGPSCAFKRPLVTTCMPRPGRGTLSPLPLWALTGPCPSPPTPGSPN